MLGIDDSMLDIPDELNDSEYLSECFNFGIVDKPFFFKKFKESIGNFEDSGMFYVLSKIVAFMFGMIEEEDEFQDKIITSVGIIDNLNLDEIALLIEKLGGTFVTNLEENPDIIMVGKKPGRKLTKAIESGIQTIYLKDLNINKESEEIFDENEEEVDYVE